MKRWTRRIVGGVVSASGILWLLSFIAAVLTIPLNPWDHHVAFTPRFRMGVWAVMYSEPSLVVFNTEDGPYRGSLITVDGAPHPPTVTHFDWPFPLIYYRRIQSDKEVVWTLMVSLLYPLVFFAIGPIIWGVAFLRRSQVDNDLNSGPTTGNT